jgi:hypothetical protein
VEVECCSLSATGSIMVMRSGGGVLLIIGKLERHPPRFLRSAACCPFPSSIPTPPGHQAPLASSTFRLDCLHTNPPPPQSIKMRRLAPTSSPFILAASFLSIGMMHISNLSRMICHLHVSSKIPTVLIFLVEYSLGCPFSSAILIRTTGYLYGPSPK